MNNQNKASGKRKESDSPPLPPKPKRKLPTRSPAWEVFTKLKDDESKCSCYCGKIYSCPSTSGTNTMMSNMKKCKDLLDSLESDSQQHLSSGGNNVYGEMGKKKEIGSDFGSGSGSDIRLDSNGIDRTIDFGFSCSRESGVTDSVETFGRNFLPVFDILNVTHRFSPEIKSSRRLGSATDDGVITIGAPLPFVRRRSREKMN
ncbi:hypothetical protein F2Q69_00026281 [Brassica cretica]|uniref:BED-type domain-containing protein n=1 Tax=Brassica cretica TaxID=69181 RepID=A0A8S9RT77_BRACR|nr:hypothetical protein F2Q69_00026281 [Brassica cretica]